MTQSPSLTIFKASAGSGKTWRLTVEYLKLLVRKPDNYRHILAMTFTNKAANEMKERVMKELVRISKEELNGNKVAETVSQETGLSLETVRERAKTALELILHDYGRFHIETIDSFYQLVLRNLARELHLGSSFNIDLDIEPVLKKAVARVYDNALQDEFTFRWLEDFICERIDNAKSRSIDSELFKFAKDHLSDERFQAESAELDKRLSDKKFLNDYRLRIRSLQKECERQLEELCEETCRPFEEALQRYGLSIDDFKKKRTGPASFFTKLRENGFSSKYYNKTLRDALDNPDEWAPAKSANAGLVRNLAQNTLIPLIIGCEEKGRELEDKISTCRLACEKLFELGLLHNISREVSRINAEENRFLLSDTGQLLRSMISDSDAPFIFEKIGVDLNHLMIDEFQDTSHIQWDNLHPLLRECMANGGNNLIVGDEKQSIYRFRNGDWRILGDYEDDNPDEDLQIKTLDTNHRSLKNVVEFNNSVFDTCLDAFVWEYGEQMEIDFSQDVRTAYGNACQKCQKDGDGWVKVSFLSESEKGENGGTDPETGEDNGLDARMLKQLVDEIEHIQMCGVPAKDIAILVRFNKYAGRIAKALNDRKSEHPQPGVCYSVVSDEAFRYDASSLILKIVASLRVMAEPDDSIAMEALKQLYEGFWPFADEEDVRCRFDSLRHLPVSELIQALHPILKLDEEEGQDAYLFSFLDQINAFITRNSSDLNDILDYWEQTLHKKTIPTGADLPGIRLLSIHKSKGLEFPTVIIPFCNWKLSGAANNDMVWCKPSCAPFDELPLLPISCSGGTSKMSRSDFAEDWEKEMTELLIDALNSLYVACTRARENLIVLSEKSPDKKNETKYAKVSDLLYRTLRADVERFDEETQTWENGLPHVGDDDSTDKTAETPVRFTSYGNKTKFRQSNRSREFIRSLAAADGDADQAEIRTDAYTNTFIEHGKLMHRIFEQIHHLDDIGKSVRQAVTDGLLSAGEEESVRRSVERSLSEPGARRWWEGSYELFNECSILFEDEHGQLQERRPDRVIRREDGSVEVIDFKFGKPHPKYLAQVREYMSLLREMGYSPVRGYLWYVEEQTVETVTEA